jgi:hypothetical protein
MGMGARTLGKTAKSKCCLGARTLEEDTRGLEVDTRTLEVIVKGKEQKEV